jgi:ribosomal protein S18 acetylase RimI-like enzyme
MTAAMVEYRSMRPEEADAVAQLWAEVFESSQATQAARLASDPAPSTHTYVAIDSNGDLLAAVHYQIAQRRTLTGEPVLVGEIDSLATRPDVRRQGHATILLRRIQEALAGEGCVWALLVTTAAGRSLYEREGWRHYPERWVRGVVERRAISWQASYYVYPFDPLHTEDGWEQIARVDQAFNEGRPLTVVRSLDFWRTRAAERIREWMTTENLTVYMVSNGSAAAAVCGYALVEFYPTAFQIRDLAVLPSAPDALEALLVAISEEAERQGSASATRLFLPREAWIEASLRRVLGASLRWGEDTGQLMARPISRDCTTQELDTLFQAPAAVFSSLDLF